jgi:type VI secretion system Hcp family effector
LRRSKLIKFSTLASIVEAFTVAPMAQAADDYFLRIEGIVGETAVTLRTKDAITVRSFSLGADNARRVRLSQLEVQKSVDSSSPTLFERLTEGTMIPSMELVARKDRASIYMRYCFQTVRVVSQSHSGAAGDESAQETLLFAYGGVSQTYPRDPQNVFASWNSITNSPLVGGPTACSRSRIE